jgi:hypothetical protein
MRGAGNARRQPQGAGTARAASSAGRQACNRHRFEAMYSTGLAVQINKFVLHLALASVWSLRFWIAPAAGADPAKEGQVALVIGNSHYETAVGSLRNTVNDAKAMAKTLRILGFAVIEKHDVTRDELLGAMLQFRAKLRGAKVGIFYFAGHGISVAGSNYLLPVKSGYLPDSVSEIDLRLLAETKLFNAEEAVADMSEAGAGCNLVILDACRSTPVARNPHNRDASPSGGLAEMSPPAGSLIAFATDAGRAANDGDGANGLYTEELMKHLLTPGLTIEQVFKRTRAGVMERSGGKQIPAEYSRLVGEDIFLAGPAPAKPVKVENASEPLKPPNSLKPTEPEKLSEEPIPKAQLVPIPTIAEINKLAGAGSAAACIEALRTYSRSRGPGDRNATPLATLLERVKESLRDPKTATQNAPQALQDCDLILAAITDCLPADHPQHASLGAKAYNRQGDALLLLGHAQEALASYNSAASLDPSDGYILYNRGRALLALDRKDEAKADFAAAAGPKFKRSGVHKLAKEALAEMK